MDKESVSDTSNVFSAWVTKEVPGSEPAQREWDLVLALAYL